MNKRGRQKINRFDFLKITKINSKMWKKDKLFSVMKN